MKITGEITLFAAIGLLFGGIFFRQIVRSHFDLLLGDVGDARLNMVILEHWWQVLQGTARWLSPPFLFPVQGVLGYSDAGFLNALPYSFLRFLGINPFSSYQSVLFASVAVGWIGTVLFLRYCLKLRMVPAITGAALFVFPNSMAVTASMHTQLFTVYYLPYLAIGIYLFLKNFAKATFVGAAAGIFVAVMAPAIFYTEYYIGWFLMFFVLLSAGAGCVWSRIRSKDKVVRLSGIPGRENLKILLPYCALSAICFIPFLLTYVPVLIQYGSRSYQEISAMLPSFIDYVNVGPNNRVWGKTLYSVFEGIGSRPMAHELIKGLPVGLLMTYLGFSAYYFRKTRHYRLAAAQNGFYEIIIDGRAADGNEKLAVLAAGLSAVILLAWLLMLKIHGFSLWWLVSKLVPGAGAIRAVYRFQHMLAFPLAMVVAIGLHQVINCTAGRIQSVVKRGACFAATAVFCLLLLGEQFNTGSLANYSKGQQQAMLAGISPPPPQAKIFAVLPDERSRQFPCEAQLDAMLIAQKYNLCTINGYSGQFPPGWDGIFEVDKPAYAASLKRWVQRYKLDTDQLYFLDLKTGSWLPATNSHSPLF